MNILKKMLTKIYHHSAVVEKDQTCQKLDLGIQFFQYIYPFVKYHVVHSRGNLVLSPKGASGVSILEIKCVQHQ